MLRLEAKKNEFWYQLTKGFPNKSDLDFALAGLKKNPYQHCTIKHTRGKKKLYAVFTEGLFYEVEAKLLAKIKERVRNEWWNCGKLK